MINNIFKNDLGVLPFEKENHSNFISISGSVFDGNSEALNDVMIETWQCNEKGEYIDGQGYARFLPNAETKKFTLRTIKPGIVKELEGKFQSPHILMSISSRGINMNFNTRIYFEDDDLSNDTTLSIINQKDKINTLIAKKIDKFNYIFDVYLQGNKETVFLDI